MLWLVQFPQSTKVSGYSCLHPWFKKTRALIRLALNFSLNQYEQPKTWRSECISANNKCLNRTFKQFLCHATEQDIKLEVKCNVIPHRSQIQMPSQLWLISRCAKKTSWRCCISGVRWTQRCPHSCFLLGLIQSRRWLHLLAVTELLIRPSEEDFSIVIYL